MTIKKTQNIFELRRKKFLSQLPDNSIAIIPNKSCAIRSNDVEYKFKSETNFYYLTGFEEPDSVCLLIKEKKSCSYILFVEPRNPDKEIWTGKRIGVKGAKSIFRADEAYNVSEFHTYLEKFIQDKSSIYYALGINKDLDIKISALIDSFRKSNRSGMKSPEAILDPLKIIHKMRLIKDAYEIECVQKAIDISKAAHIQALAISKPGMYEYELEAVIEFKFRSQGANGPAYPSIVGSGKNSTILHYIQNNKKIQKNDLVLIDAGCEYDNYASDITRTFPITKKFSSVQKDIYELVLEAQLKAIEEIKPGKRFIDSYRKAVLVMVEGLKHLGLLKGSTQEIIKKGKYKNFFMHKLGHWLGLDVHDVGPYIDEKENSIKLVPGMIMTVEPGIYISDSILGISKKISNIGVRIEDDILVTKSGNKVLSSGIPKTIEEIEAYS